MKHIMTKTLQSRNNLIVGYLEAGCMVNLKTTEQKISLAVH